MGLQKTENTLFEKLSRNFHVGNGFSRESIERYTANKEGSKNDKKKKGDRNDEVQKSTFLIDCENLLLYLSRATFILKKSVANSIFYKPTPKPPPTSTTNTKSTTNQN